MIINSKLQIILVVCFTFIYSTTFSQNWITQTTPTKNQVNVSASSSIKLVFNRAILQTSINSNNLVIRGSVKGTYQLSFEYSSSDNSLTIIPSQAFRIGERVFVTVAGSIQDSTGNFMTNSFNYSFTVKVNGGTNTFTLGTTSFPTGILPNRLTSADFDNDGDIDIIVSNRNSFVLEMFRNNGNASFEKTIFYYAASSPTNIAPSDFDNDGDIDLAVCFEDNDIVLFFKNDGNGQFSSSLNLVTNDRPIAIILSNFDADGYPDLAVANWNGNVITIYKNNGSGGFILHSSLFAGDRPMSLASADFNNDGYMDLAIGMDWYPLVAIARNNGLGNFTTIQNISVGARPYSITENDFDNNGYPDLCSANLYDNSMSVMINNGANFSSNQTPAGGNFALTAINGDYDSDGDIDLCIGFSLSSNIGAYENNGAGSFTGHIYPSILGPISSIHSNDFDNDGDLDIASTNYQSNTLSIFYNNNTSGIEPVNTEIPSTFSISQNFPNPFNPSTKINFNIPKGGMVEISLWNTLGKKVGVLLNEQLGAGMYSINFNADKFNLMSGVYFYKITAGHFSETKKMLLIK